MKSNIFTGSYTRCSLIKLSDLNILCYIIEPYQLSSPGRGEKGKKQMIIQIDNDTVIDTDNDFSSGERHVLQKLLGWKTMVKSIAEFQQKKESALAVGWNNSGPIRESRAFTLAVQQLEKELRLQLKT